MKRGLCVPAWLLAAFLFVYLGWGALPDECTAEETGGKELSAQQVLDHIAQSYGGLKSLRVEGTTTVEHFSEGAPRAIGVPFELKVRRPERLYFTTEVRGYGFDVVWDGAAGWIASLHRNEFRQYRDSKTLSAFLGTAISETELVGLPLTLAEDMVAADPAKALTTGRSDIRLVEPATSDVYTLAFDQVRMGPSRLSVSRETFLPERLVVDLTERTRQITAKSKQELPADYRLTVTVAFTKVTENQSIPDSAFVFRARPEAKFSLVGRPAPDFTLGSLTGRKVTLSQLRGKVVLVDFWATWCRPCWMSMPELQKLHDQFAGKGLVVLGITNEEKKEVEPFVAQRRFTFTILFDSDDAVGQAYRVPGLPTSILIDRKGVVRQILVGYHPPETYREALAELGIN